MHLIGYRYGALVQCSHIRIGNEQVSPSVSAQNLGVILDSGITLEAHVNSVLSLTDILMLAMKSKCTLGQIFIKSVWNRFAISLLLLKT